MPINQEFIPARRARMCIRYDVLTGIQDMPENVPCQENKNQRAGP